MRTIGSNGGLTALAVAGSYVVVLGWDLNEHDIRTHGVLGFAVRRTRLSDGEVSWMPGMKTFRSVEPHPAPGSQVSSRKHPLQTFQWSDYSVSPEESYLYRVVALAGAPGSLVEHAAVDLQVRTESVDQGDHAVFFNRGAIASQEYARRFQNRKPEEVGQAAFDWLSRGLVESLERFIDQAQKGDALLGAFFEFKNERIYARLREARSRGVKIKILYDGDSQREKNEEKLAGSGIVSLTKPRTRSGNYAHNKFLVFIDGGKPSQVWTGATNLSPNGLFGHSNNAHIVRKPKIAEAFVEYWKILDADRTVKPTAKAVTLLSPAPAPAPPAGDTMAVFSPRADLTALDWYAEMAAGAERALFMTFAFGMNGRFVPIYDQTDAVLRFALMEKKGNGRKFKEQAKEIDRIRRRPNTTVSVGAWIELNAFDQWLAETDRAVEEAHVLFVHTKYMLVDPLGRDPVVVVGSANFSNASTDTNDENMLVIRGNRAVADIYFGEFMRLFSHYSFRESLKFKGAHTASEALRRKHLAETPDWVDLGYFDEGSDRFLRRLYFSGQ
jgi:phosphatidylserine/phosphatidylglycerophosphate/cardiolipin synthase-like enzyme